MSKAGKREKYGLKWADDLDDAQIEREMIRYGGYFVNKSGVVCGGGLLQHFKNYWALLWPEDSQTWWTDLILENIIKNTFTSIVGPASSWKSGTVSRIALMDWSCWPDCTSVIMSSTDMEGLRSRIYGETTMMWKIQTLLSLRVYWKHQPIGSRQSFGHCFGAGKWLGVNLGGDHRIRENSSLEM